MSSSIEVLQKELHVLDEKYGVGGLIVADPVSSLVNKLTDPMFESCGIELVCTACARSSYIRAVLSIGMYGAQKAG